MKRWMLAGVALWAGQVAMAGTLNYYISPPATQNTEVGTATVETFTGAAGSIGASGNWAVGAYTATTGSLTNANQFGGANGAGQFLSVLGGPITVTLSAGRQYLGFWWSAGDSNNRIEFYDQSDNLLLAFTTADLTTFLSGAGGVTALDGSVYAKSSYFGNPNAAFSGQNGTEPYAYVHLRLTGTTTTIQKVVLKGANFELDNLAVDTSAAVNNTWVSYGQQTINDPAAASASVPTLSEWATATLALLMAAGGVVALRRRC